MQKAVAAAAMPKLSSIGMCRTLGAVGPWMNAYAGLEEETMPEDAELEYGKRSDLGSWTTGDGSSPICRTAPRPSVGWCGRR